jgi:hypothetical protein
MSVAFVCEHRRTGFFADEHCRKRVILNSPRKNTALSPRHVGVARLTVRDL